MSRQCIWALSRLRVELDQQLPRPIGVMEFFAAVKQFGDANELFRQELQRLNIIDIIGDGLILLCGWPTGMVTDE